MVMVVVVVMLVGFADGVIVIGRVVMAGVRDMIRVGMVVIGFGGVIVVRSRGMIMVGSRWRLGRFFGVIIEQVKAFNIDEHGTIVRCAGRREDSDDGERIVLVSIGSAVRRLECAAHFEAGFAG
ncbi:MAG TPA: hypothetical protein VGG30_07330, partial [Pirellulales bacterium]